MMLDDAPQKVGDPCCGQLQEAQDYKEAVESPDGEDRRPREDDVKNRQELCQNHAQDHAHGAAPHHAAVAEVTAQEFPHALPQLARLPQHTAKRKDGLALPLQPRIEARVQLPQRFGQRGEISQPL